MFDFSTLPPHILTSVLVNLDITDFRNAVRTCKSWYYASCDPKIIKQIRVYIPPSAKTIEFLSRPIDYLDLNNPNMNQFQYRELFSSFGHSITELDIVAPLSTTQFYEIFMHLPRVRKFYFYDKTKFILQSNDQTNEDIRNLALHNLANIRWLTIHMSTNDYQLYYAILAGCKNLETFIWYGSDAVQIDHSTLLKNIGRETRKSPQIMGTVTELVINDIDKQQNGKFFQSFIQLKLSKLKRIQLSEISNTYDLTFKEFCQAYNYLEYLSLSSCTDYHLHDVCTFITNLKSLYVEYCNASISLQEIKNLKILEHLSITRHKNLTGINGLVILINMQLHSLKSLTLTKISSELFNAICCNCRGLESLSLFAIDTKDCEPLFRHMTQLKTLQLGFTEPPKCHSSKIISSSVWNITKLTKLESLWINQYVPGITPELIRQFSNLNQSFMASIFDPSDEEAKGGRLE